MICPASAKSATLDTRFLMLCCNIQLSHPCYMALTALHAYIYLHTRSSKDCSSQCNLCSRGARELMMEYISWSMNCLCASTHPPKVAPEYSKNLDPLLNLRWWASSKLWPFWSTVQCWLSPWSLQGCRYWDYAGVPRCPRRGSGWSRFLQNHLWFTILLWKEIMLSLLRARGDSMDIP